MILTNNSWIKSAWNQNMWNDVHNAIFSLDIGNLESSCMIQDRVII